jgi:putative two-component system response regulator
MGSGMSKMANHHSWFDRHNPLLDRRALDGAKANRAPEVCDLLEAFWSATDALFKVPEVDLEPGSRSILALSDRIELSRTTDGGLSGNDAPRVMAFEALSSEHANADMCTALDASHRLVMLTTPPSPGSVDQGREPPRWAGNHALRRVLIVDDEADVLRGLCAVLVGAGYHVNCASSLREAVQALRRQRFALVLTDLYLGDRDLGIEIVQVAREQRPHTPVILLTGRPSFDRAQEALRNHVADIVVKPVEVSQLLATCRRVIQETELARRNSDLESANRVLTSVLPRTIEMKDPTTSGHANRVVGYTDRLAHRCGVSAEDRASLHLAALLHDIGKIGVPDHILRKPGPLTSDEMEIVKRHPAMGYEVLAELDEHENVRNWVYQHHERWDGKGYPNGLAGEEVALPGRILVLAEVYDALAEQRSYKPAWPVDRIVSLFREHAGKQFDPDLAHLVADGLERQGYRFFALASDTLF